MIYLVIPALIDDGFLLAYTLFERLISYHSMYST